MQNGRNRNQFCLSNMAIALPAIRILNEIRKLQPEDSVVGVCLQGDTTLRLNTTVNLYLSGRIQSVIVSGGADENAIRDEKPAKMMMDYLIEHGIPKNKIYLEEQSQTTHDHPSFVREIAMKHGFHNLLIITSGYHLLRAYLRFLNSALKNNDTFRIYGYSAGTFWSWIQKTPTGGQYRILYFICKELTKIRTYYGLATFDEAWKYIRKLKKTRVGKK